MYKIIGADQKEYGPISAEQIQQWIIEGRVNGQTQVCAEGTQDWKPLTMFPEFGAMASPSATAIPVAETTAPVSPEEILARDYTLDMVSCISRAWVLFKANFTTLFVTFLLGLALIIAAGGAIQLILLTAGANRLPYATTQYLTPIYFIFMAIVMGPATGGLYRVYLSVIRGQPANVVDLFIGFKNFQDLFLGKLIPGLIGSLCMLPYTIVNAAKMAPIMDGLRQNPSSVNPQEILPQMISGFSASLPAFLLCMIPATYLAVNWQFTLALIIDKKMGFWTAMTTSWKMVHKHWFQIFGLLVLVGLINVPGLCACCIGVVVTIPIGMTALMYAYEDIFGRKTS